MEKLWRQTKGSHDFFLNIFLDIICCRAVIGDSWIEFLEPILQDKVARDSRKRRSYSGASVGDLLRFVKNTAQKAQHRIKDASIMTLIAYPNRFVRNTYHHYHELAPEVRAALGPKEELGNFWVSRFPCLLTSVHAAMKRFSQDTNCARINHFYQ